MFKSSIGVSAKDVPEGSGPVQKKNGKTKKKAITSYCFASGGGEGLYSAGKIRRYGCIYNRTIATVIPLCFLMPFVFSTRERRC